MSRGGIDPWNSYAGPDPWGSGGVQRARRDPYGGALWVLLLVGCAAAVTARTSRVRSFILPNPASSGEKIGIDPFSSMLHTGALQ